MPRSYVQVPILPTVFGLEHFKGQTFAAGHCSIGLPEFAKLQTKPFIYSRVQVLGYLSYDKQLINQKKSLTVYLK